MRYNVIVGVRIAMEAFPARVTLPSGAGLDPAKVFVADGRVQVYVLSNGEPKLYFDRELVSSEGSARRGFHLQVPDGEVVVYQSTGCGCGNPLRSWNPWPGQRRILERL